MERETSGDAINESHFDQAAIPAEARRRRTEQNFHGGLTTSANGCWCANVKDTTSTLVLGSSVSSQRDTCDVIAAHHSGGGMLAVTTSRGGHCEPAATNDHQETIVDERSPGDYR